MKLPENSILSDYKPSPTALDFHLSNAPIKGMMGPVGCAKTTDCLMNIFIRACQMPKNSDGKRRSRWGIVRDTYPNLETTTLRSAIELFPEAIFGKYKRTYPITWVMKFNDVELELIFLSISSTDDVSKLLSLELTGIYANELSTLPKEIVVDGYERTGRFPKQSDYLQSYYCGVIFDTNPPPEESWQYNYFEIESHKNTLFKLFKHPPGLIKDENDEWITNPQASNLKNLRAGYYTDMVKTRSKEGLKVYALGEYGKSSEGKPVFWQYNDKMHYSGEVIEADKSRTLYLGFDFGLNPSCDIVQFIDGACKVLGVITTERASLRELLDNVLMPFLRDKYLGFTIKGWGDPSGMAKATGEGRHCFQILRDYGLDIEPAPSNSISARHDAVIQYLVKMPGGKPGFVISRGCELIRTAMSVTYVYERLRVLGSAGEVKYKDVPADNDSTHIIDALQYVCLGYNEDTLSLNAPRTEARFVQHDW